MSLLQSVLRCTAIASLAVGGLSTARAQKEAPTRYKAVLSLSDKEVEQDEAIKDLKKRAKELKKTFAFRAARKNDPKITVTFSALSEKDAQERLAALIDAPRLELRAVHPQWAKLGPQVAAGKKIVPGYKYYPYEFKDEKAKDKDATIKQDLLLEKRDELTGKHVSKAYPNTARAGVINVELTSTGGKHMRNLTKNMEKGVDRLAVVLDGKVMSAPTVNDILSRNFIIMGIDDNDARVSLAAALSAPLRSKLVLESLTALPAP